MFITPFKDFLHSSQLLELLLLTSSGSNYSGITPNSINYFSDKVLQNKSLQFKNSVPFFYSCSVVELSLQLYCLRRAIGSSSSSMKSYNVIIFNITFILLFSISNWLVQCLPLGGLLGDKLSSTIFLKLSCRLALDLLAFQGSFFLLNNECADFYLLNIWDFSSIKNCKEMYYWFHQWSFLIQKRVSWNDCLRTLLVIGEFVYEK